MFATISYVVFATASVSAETRVMAVDLHQRLYPDRPVQVSQVPPARVPRGGVASLQFAIVAGDDALATLSVGAPTARDGAKLGGSIRIYRLAPVHVEGNTQGSLKNRPGGQVPEAWRKQLARMAPFDTLEVLIEDNKIKLAEGCTHGVIIEVAVPRDARPGSYRSALRVTLSGRVEAVPLELHVHETTLPAPLPLHCMHWLWPEPENLTNGDVPAWWSQRHWRLLGNSMRRIRSFGDDTLYTPLVNYREPLIQVTRGRDGTFTFDYARFDHWIKLGLSAGFRQFAGHHILNLPRRSMGGVYVIDEPTGKRIPLLQSATDREAWLTFLPTFYDSLDVHLKQQGWLDRYVQHQYDEPKDAALYRRLAGITRQHLLGARTIDAINSSRQQLYSPLVDIQVFNLIGLIRHQDIVRQRRAARKDAWLYHCTSPYPPYPNRHLDSLLTECRLYPLLCFRFGADGFLHWGANIYRGADEYKTSIGPFPNGSQNPGHPPGDNWLYYRGPNGLRPSMRIVSFREGLIDYALLTMLAERDGAEARELVQQIVGSVTDFQRDAHAYHALRRRLLDKLDKKK